MAEGNLPAESVGTRIENAFSMTGMARETMLPGGEELKRTFDERFERGEMYRILQAIRGKRSSAITGIEKGDWQQRLLVAEEISENLARNLDSLNKQYYNPENLKMVPVELDQENYQMPVRHYFSEKVSGQDHLPLIVLGGATSGDKVTKSTVEAFALQYPGRDIYVVSYPDNPTAIIPKDFPEKIKKSGGFDVYTKLLKKTIENLNIEKFDLIGISMGGGLGLNMAKDEAFAKKIKNLMIISPTNVQSTKSKIAIAKHFGTEFLHGVRHPKEFLRVGRLQPGQESKSNPGTGFLLAADIVRKNAFTPDDLAKIQVDGRVMVITGEKDQVISGEETLGAIAKTNNIREGEGKKPFEGCLIRERHHNMGDAYAAGIVKMIRETENSKLPEQCPLYRLENSTAKVLIREDSILAPVANQILKSI